MLEENNSKSPVGIFVSLAVLVFGLLLTGLGELFAPEVVVFNVGLGVIGMIVLGIGAVSVAVGFVLR